MKVVQFSRFPTPSPIVKGGGAETLYTIKLLSYLVRNNMEQYYPCTWLSFVNQKDEKKKKKKKEIEVCS